MASNAPTRDSTAKSTNEREIPIEKIEVAPTRARRAKRASPKTAESDQLLLCLGTSHPVIADSVVSRVIIYRHLPN